MVSLFLCPKFGRDAQAFKSVYQKIALFSINLEITKMEPSRNIAIALRYRSAKNWEAC